MKIRFTILIFALLLFGSCGNDSKLFPGFSETKSGIHYKLYTIGESENKPENSNYITVSIAYRTIADSVFFQGMRKFQITETQVPGSIDECISMLSLGDSAAFFISADNFFGKTLETNLPGFIASGSLMRIDIKLHEIQTERQHLMEKEAFLHWVEDFGEYEKVILKQYIEGQPLDFEPTGSGLFYIPVQHGTGNTIKAGDTITVHYEGRFFNGKFFDSTRKRNEPFQFVYGQKWQVIPGLEEAIGMMRREEKSLFIIPSGLAFGQGGSSTGIVPAFTSVIFEVEIIDVKPGKL
jgi:FKBP-type peptidyl-prolyl cis-trans isomerase